MKKEIEEIKSQSSTRRNVLGYQEPVHFVEHEDFLQLFSHIAELEAARQKGEEERERLMRAIKAVQDLINESHGVYGLHLNGDLSPWDELLEGGKYEEWLLPLSKALEPLRI